VSRYSFLAIVAFAGALQLAATHNAAQNPPPAAPGSVQEFIEEKERHKQEKDLQPFELPDTAGLEKLDPATREAALQAMREYYDYRTSGFKHRRRVFDWQLLSSKIIFIIVVLLVSAGIYFSGVQFRASMRAAASASRIESGGQPSVAGIDTDIEASFSSIKVKSSVLGVIILVISFLFFYMYLRQVYPIEEIF
jgi:hypothetical protein